MDFSSSYPNKKVILISKLRRKMAQSEQEVENLRTLLEQHWLHCRHLESERAWFMSIYGAVAGGILAFIAKASDTNLCLNNFPLFYTLISFLIVLTFFGFFLTLRWAFTFEEHRERVEAILKKLKLSELKLNGKEVNLTMYIPREGFFKVFNAKILFPLFYLVVLIGVTLVLFLVIPAPAWIKWMSSAASIIALCLGVWWYFLPAEVKRRNEAGSP
jgi:hypothetical protein